MRFDEFATARLPAVLRFAGVLTGDRGLAEDVVQEVLIRAHKRWPQIGELASRCPARSRGVRTRRSSRYASRCLGTIPVTPPVRAATLRVLATLPGIQFLAYRAFLGAGWTNATPSAAASAQTIPGQ